MHSRRIQSFALKVFQTQIMQQDQMRMHQLQGLSSKLVMQKSILSLQQQGRKMYQTRYILRVFMKSGLVKRHLARSCGAAVNFLMFTNWRKASHVTLLLRDLAQEEIMSKEVLLFLIDNKELVRSKKRYLLQIRRGGCFSTGWSS